MIKKIKQILTSATGLDVKPFETKSIEDCICYVWYMTDDDGAKARHKLELRLITTTYEQAEVNKKKIIEALVNTGDNMTIEGIYNCDLNGGGQLREYATNTIHTLLYFDIITKSQND